MNVISSNIVTRIKDLSMLHFNELLNELEMNLACHHSWFHLLTIMRCKQSHISYARSTLSYAKVGHDLDG